MPHVQYLLILASQSYFRVCINSTNMNQQKALEATSELTIFLMQLQGEEGPETNLLQLDTCWWGAMYNKSASGKVIKKNIPGGRMHWLLRSSLQIWCKIHRYLHLRRMCNIRKNILRQRRQSGQPMHTSSYRGLMVLSSEFSWRSDFPDHIFILQVSTSSTSSV